MLGVGGDCSKIRSLVFMVFNYVLLLGFQQTRKEKYLGPAECAKRLNNFGDLGRKVSTRLQNG